MDDVEPTDDDGEQLDDETDDVTTPGKNTPRPPGPCDKRIGETVNEVLADLNWDYSDFVREVRPAHQGERWNKNRIGRLVRGERRISVTELLDVIATLKTDRERFFKLAGIIDDKDNTESHLEHDVHIGDEAREMLLDNYRSARQRFTAAQRSGDSSQLN